jgi:sodium-dependent dicarboxylate transporter 2/3/5
MRESCLNIGFWMKLVSALFVSITIWYLCNTLASEQRVVAAVFSIAIVLWATEAIAAGVVGVLAPLLLVGVGTLDTDIYLKSFFDPVVFLIFGSFIVALGFERSGLANRLAIALLRRPYFSKSYATFLIALGLLSSGISLLMSNTAVAAMMLPLTLTMSRHLGESLSTKNRTGALLMITWGSSVAVGFLVGTPPNLIAAGYAERLGTRITFVEWMAFGIPIHVIMIFAAWLVLYFLYGARAVTLLDTTRLPKNPPSCLSPAERATGVVVVAMFLGWSLPDILAMLLGVEKGLSKFISAFFSPTNVALAGAVALVALPRRWRPFDRKEVLKINWNTIALFGGGIALGQAAFTSGLTHTIGAQLIELTGVHTVLGITLICTFLAIMLSELISNTAAAAALMPLATSLSEVLQVSPLPPLLGTALGASFGFMMPISTPPNSIVYASRLVPLHEMMKAGLLIDLVGGCVVVIVLYLSLPFLGWW